MCTIDVGLLFLSSIRQPGSPSLACGLRSASLGNHDHDHDQQQTGRVPNFPSSSYYYLGMERPFLHPRIHASLPNNGIQQANHSASGRERAMHDRQAVCLLIGDCQPSAVRCNIHQHDWHSSANSLADRVRKSLHSSSTWVTPRGSPPQPVVCPLPVPSRSPSFFSSDFPRPPSHFVLHI